MKKSYVILILVGFLILITVITNPDSQAHKDAVERKLNSYENESKDSEGLTKLEEGIGNFIGGFLIDKFIETSISCNNYVLFSTTKISWQGESNIIGIGIFGNVFLSDEIRNFLDQNSQDDNESATSNSDVSDVHKNIFISGMKRSQFYTFKDIFQKESASLKFKYQYISKRKFDIEYLFDQWTYVFNIINENDEYSRLDTEFERGLDDFDELLETSNLQIGQYDFDGDETDELIIAIQVNPNDKFGQNGDNGACINVFKLIRDKWVRIGSMKAIGILGDYIPKVEIKKSKITIKRNLRGFYYQWTYLENNFEDTSDM